MRVKRYRRRGRKVKERKIIQSRRKRRERRRQKVNKGERDREGLRIHKERVKSRVKES